MNRMVLPLAPLLPGVVLACGSPSGQLKALKDTSMSFNGRVLELAYDGHACYTFPDLRAEMDGHPLHQLSSGGTVRVTDSVVPIPHDVCDLPEFKVDGPIPSEPTTTFRIFDSSRSLKMVIVGWTADRAASLVGVQPWHTPRIHPGDLLAVQYSPPTDVLQTIGFSTSAGLGTGLALLDADGGLAHLQVPAADVIGLQPGQYSGVLSLSVTPAITACDAEQCLIPPTPTSSFGSAVDSVLEIDGTDAGMDGGTDGGSADAGVDGGA